MFVVGRVVGDPVEEPWEDKQGKSHVQRKVSVVDSGTRSVVEISVRESDWESASGLRDGDSVSFDISSLSADRFGRIKMYGKPSRNGSESA